MNDLQAAAVGIDTNTAFRCCRGCFNFYGNHVRDKTGVVHPLISQTHAPVRGDNVKVLTMVFKRENVLLVRHNHR